MHISSRRSSLRIDERNEVPVLVLKKTEIWDGADLALLRETLSGLIRKKQRCSVGIELSSVQVIPSGFFGMLSAWHLRGTEIRLYSPHERIQKMLWFAHFFEKDPADCTAYILKERPRLQLQDHEPGLEDFVISKN